jgi:hypothetical protein
VSEQLLNGADVGAALEQVGGEGMAKSMCADVLRVNGVVVQTEYLQKGGRSCRTCLTETMIATKMVSCPD